ncbi:hypothetical protein COLO4_29676 [Corchorus olitorius]|uniref:Uncharacterized protein n=1 Tax=Corchorus olitorius TaxID=93759 RepID=A0A1R3HDR1_9ROSI|nr:hypothetical protein COLO4_29676 [Corchorus olitorius]
MLLLSLDCLADHEKDLVSILTGEKHFDFSPLLQQIMAPQGILSLRSKY